MYSFIKQILQTKICIETVHGFIQSEMTSIHTVSIDTSLMIFNNGWTCTILNTWSHKRSHGLVQVLTKSTRIYYMWDGIAESEICSTENVMGRFLCVSVCV